MIGKKVQRIQTLKEAVVLLVETLAAWTKRLEPGQCTHVDKSLSLSGNKAQSSAVQVTRKRKTGHS
jgi:hypothetical protein